MRILVTGAGGFIGRRLVPLLIERFGSDAITCLVWVAAKPVELEAIAAFQGAGVAVMHGDLTVVPVAAVAPPPVDLLFHLAANIDTDTPASEHRVNDQGTANLLTWLGPQLRGCRVVYTSSIAVMDRDGVATGPLTEQSPCTPRTAYGSSKLRGEEVIQAAAGDLAFTWTIPRLPTVYGPGQKAGGLFDLLITGARRGGWISRLNWPGRTSVVFVDDVARVLVDLAVRESAANQVYCVSSGEDLTLSDIARTASLLLGRPSTAISVPRPIWGALRHLVWSPIVSAVVPGRARVAYWRFTLVVDDGFWYDARKFLAQNTLPLIQVREGLRRIIEADANPPG